MKRRNAWIVRGTSLKFRLEHFSDRSGGPSACWPWTGELDKDGYGKVFWKGTKRAHRMAWEMANGRPVPKGMCVCHDCPTGDNPSCINPAHLWLGTNSENIADRDTKDRHAKLKGEDHPGVRLTRSQVIAIRGDARTQPDIAADYGISFQQVSKIKLRQRWGHIP